MRFRKLLAILLSVILLLSLLAGCSASKLNGSTGNVGMDSDNLSKPENGAQSSTPENRKLVRKMWLNGETEDLDALLANIDQRISALSGYVEDRNVYNGNANTTRSRYASLTVRIPVEKMDSFVSQVSDVSNIIYQRETAEDVTLSYIATQSRITALETEQARLLELLSEAETMADLLAIEARLTTVRTELEEVTSQLRLYDNLVDYGTIYLEISEVREYTQEEPENFWERIAAGFVESLQNIGTGFAEFFAFLVISSPYLLLIGGIVIIILLIVRHRSKKKNKNTPPPFPTDPAN